MARRSSSIGFLGRFGRSEDLRALDAAMKAVDLHPALVPEGLKLAVSNLMKDHAGDGEPPAHAYPFVATLFAYCLLGPEHFAAANGAETAASAETRIEAAIDDADGLDAQLVLLALHSRLIRPEVVERFGLEIG
ncbi:MAG: hypothetical protein KF723_15190 [Rhizobiaceae bacterium]|nr:hypothetical protein [Rhizobiaceae bacterium]